MWLQWGVCGFEGGGALTDVLTVSSLISKPWESGEKKAWKLNVCFLLSVFLQVDNLRAIHPDYGSRVQTLLDQHQEDSSKVTHCHALTGDDVIAGPSQHSSLSLSLPPLEKQRARLQPSRSLGLLLRLQDVMPSGSCRRRLLPWRLGRSLARPLARPPPAASCCINTRLEPLIALCDDTERLEVLLGRHSFVHLMPLTESQVV